MGDNRLTASGVTQFIDMLQTKATKGNFRCVSCRVVSCRVVSCSFV
jgi:hypothetical protein